MDNETVKLSLIGEGRHSNNISVRAAIKALVRSTKKRASQKMDSFKFLSYPKGFCVGRQRFSGEFDLFQFPF